MPKLTLEVPSDVVDALRLPPEEAEDEIRRRRASSSSTKQKHGVLRVCTS